MAFKSTNKSCSQFKFNEYYVLYHPLKVKNESLIFAVGGIDENYNLLDSIELMENNIQEWNFGPSLEYAICHMAIVSFENFAIMLGGKTNQEDQAGLFIHS